MFGVTPDLLLPTLQSCRLFGASPETLEPPKPSRYVRTCLFCVWWVCRAGMYRYVYLRQVGEMVICRDEVKQYCKSPMIHGNGRVHPTCRQIKKNTPLKFLRKQLALDLRSQTKLLQQRVWCWCVSKGSAVRQPGSLLSGHLGMHMGPLQAHTRAVTKQMTLAGLTPAPGRTDTGSGKDCGDELWKWAP